MPLSTPDLQRVSRETKAARKSAATFRPAINRQRVSGAVMLSATDDAGNLYTLVLTHNEPGKAHLLTRAKKSGEWVCSCFRARWRQDCPHLEALRLHVEAA